MKLIRQEQKKSTNNNHTTNLIQRVRERDREKGKQKLTQLICGDYDDFSYKFFDADDFQWNRN